MGRKTSNKGEKIMASSFVKYPVATKATMSVMYHNTEVVNLTNNVLTLRNGGWKTSTTKSRINQYAGHLVGVYQKGGEWFVKIGCRSPIPFVDGMKIDFKTNKVS
jgi:hypothetical protein